MPGSVKQRLARQEAPLMAGPCSGQKLNSDLFDIWKASKCLATRPQQPNEPTLRGSKAM